MAERKTSRGEALDLACIADNEDLRQSVLRHIVSFGGSDYRWAGPQDYLKGLAYAVRERLAEKWIRTQREFYAQGAKRVYYLSLEFLVGRSLRNNLACLGLWDEAVLAMAELGFDLDELKELEWDAGLGNGGLGRLASCYLDSMAALGIPGYGYGIRYDYGIFYQVIQDGWQVERPDNWQRVGCPWEFERPHYLYEVRFYGQVREYADSRGRLRHDWQSAQNVMAMAVDMLIPGQGNGSVISMRLWAAKSSREFDLDFFQDGQYVRAIEEKARTENISKVLYPNDTKEQGQELRLKQQYFFVAATFQDILRRFRKDDGDMANLPDKVAVQLNDTHPTIAIAELMRILVDVELMDWEPAWDICVRTFAYTNHTVLPEALEQWPERLLARILPRHAQIIREIDRRFREEVRERFPGDEERVERMAIVANEDDELVRMAHLAVVGCHAVNGVAELHTDILRSTVFRDFAELWPERFLNVTNGVTPRRFLEQCNPGLSALITEAVGPGWAKDLGRLAGLREHAADAGFQGRWLEARQAGKEALAGYVRNRAGVDLPPDFLFDVQVKRIHEYKRQVLNVLHVATLYARILRGRPPATPRAVLFGGKAAPAYVMAKLIIKLINDVAATVNADPACRDLLRVVFVPNFCVSNAEKIIPAAELSEQISTAGFEASGTGNMKFALNGAITIGALDGANVEIRRRVGPENFFLFGLAAGEVMALKKIGYRPAEHVQDDPELAEVLDMIAAGRFNPGRPDLFKPLVDSLLREDRFMVLADYRAYVDCQARVEAAYQDRARWARMSILNTAGMGHFSSDRAVAEYAEKIWGVQSVKNGKGC
ncbi:MAG: glycogen/starch/alpha-glucan phosphorylase [Thermodesulfobacteriota bacterium]